MTNSISTTPTLQSMRSGGGTSSEFAVITAATAAKDAKWRSRSTIPSAIRHLLRKLMDPDAQARMSLPAFRESAFFADCGWNFSDLLSFRVRAPWAPIADIKKLQNKDDSDGSSGDEYSESDDSDAFRSDSDPLLSDVEKNGGGASRDPRRLNEEYWWAADF